MNLLSAGSGGALNYARNLTPRLGALVRDTHKGKLTVLSYPGLLPDLSPAEAGSIQIREIPQKNGLRRVVWEQSHIGQILGEFKPDVVFSPYQIGVTPKGVRSVLMLRNMEPFLYQNYDSPFRKNVRNCLLRNFSASALRKATHVVAVSEYVKNHAIHNLGLSPKKLSVIYHGRDTSFSSVVADNDDKVLQQAELAGHPFMFTCGSLLPYRRCEDIVRAFVERLSIDFPSLHLVVAGAPLDPHYVGTACKFPPDLRCRIHFLGHVSVDLLAALYRKCAVFVTATEVEACPNIAIEAMASGCRIVSANTAPLQELFGASATYYQQRDWRAMESVVTLVLSEPRKYEFRSSLALELAERFSWEKCARETLGMLQNVVTLPR